MTPRLSDSAWAIDARAAPAIDRHLRQQIELEEFGRIHQSNQLVMRVSF